MKLDKVYINIRFLLVALMLASCSSGPKKQSINLAIEKNAQVEMIDATRYIPQRTKDEETGQLVPYVAMPNPYTQQKGRIDSQSVTLFVSARKAIQSGTTAKAKKLLEKLVTSDSSLSGPWVLLGDIAQLDKQYDTAIAHYAKAIETNQSNVNAYLRLAKLQRQQGQFLPAQNTYVKALSIWKDFPEAHLNLAILYDVYLNKALFAQRHLEAYQFLTQGKNKQASKWLGEIQQRTGKAISLNVEARKASSLEPS